MDVPEFIKDIRSQYQAELKINDISLLPTTAEMKKVYGNSQLGSTRELTIETLQDDTPNNLSDAEKFGNELKLDLNKYLERVINFTVNRETEEENYFYGVNKNLKKISKILLMSSEAEEKLVQELEMKSRYFLEMTKGLFRETLLEQVDLDQSDHPDANSVSETRDLEFWKEANDYSKNPIVSSENVRALLNQHKLVEASSNYDKMRVFDFVHSKSGLKGSLIDRFMNSIQDQCKREKVFAMKGIKESAEGVLDFFKSTNEDSFLNLYLEICAFMVDAQAYNKNFPDLSMQSVTEVLQTFEMNQNRVISILKSCEKDSLSKRDLFTV